MHVEMTRYEAEILIAVLVGAEGAFMVTNPPLVEAMQELRAFRSALTWAYLRSVCESAPSADAVDPDAGRPSRGGA